MIYYILYELIYSRFKDQDWYLVKALNVFQYVTFRTAYASVTAMLISLLFGRKLIAGLKRWNIGQQIREEGPQAHIAKRDTPTMGGLLIIGSVIISTLLWAKLNGLYIWITIVATLGFGAVGFADDYIKLVKHRSLGLTGKQKLLFQLLIAIAVWLVLYHLDPVLPDQVFMEHQHSILQKHRRSEWHQRDRALSLSGLDHHRSAGCHERGESDRRIGWAGDQCDVHRDDGADRVYLFEQRRALGELSGFNASAGSVPS